MAFNRIADIFNLLKTRNPAFGKRVHEAEALGRWEAAVGPAIAKHSRAIKVEDGVLWVEVDHPIWKSALHHRKRQILDILNAGRSSGESAGPAPGKPARGRSRKPADLAPAKDVLTDLLFLEPRHRGGSGR